MAANPTPRNDSVLLARTMDLQNGSMALGAELGIKLFTAEKMLELRTAALEAIMEVGRLKMLRSEVRKEFRRVDREGRKVLGRVRCRFAAKWGNRHDHRWEELGYNRGTTMVPESQAGRMGLLGRVELFLAAHPEEELEVLGVTSAICHAAREAMSDAKSAVNHHKALLRAAVQQKNKAVRKLRLGWRGLINELNVLMEPADPRWQRFRLKPPARVTAPKPVKRVSLSLVGEGDVLATWPPAVRATRYRIKARAAGEEEFQPVATVHDTDALLRDIPPDTEIEVVVIAANSADEAAPSPVATIRIASAPTVRQPKKTKPPPVPDVVEPPLPPPVPQPVAQELPPPAAESDPEPIPPPPPEDPSPIKEIKGPEPPPAKDEPQSAKSDTSLEQGWLL